MLKVTNIKVRSLDVDFFEVTWKIENTTEDLLDYTFQVFRSEAQAGPFDAISEPFQNRFIYVDNHIRNNHLYRQWNYKIRVAQKSTGNTVDFGPGSPGPEPDLIATELRKHINLLMREFIGRRCWVFPVRTFGQRCSCWNPTLQKKTRSGCITCFDTGFVYGYLTPIEAWLSIDPNPDVEQNMSVGPTQQQTTTARMGYFPAVKPRDMIVEPENLRWKVVSVNSTQQVRTPVHQEIQIHHVPSSDIEYSLQFDIGDSLSNIWLSPSRNYGNAQNLEAFTDEEFPKVLQIYGSSYPKVTT